MPAAVSFYLPSALNSALVFVIVRVTFTWSAGVSAHKKQSFEHCAGETVQLEKTPNTLLGLSAKQAIIRQRLHCSMLATHTG